MTTEEHIIEPHEPHPDHYTCVNCGAILSVFWNKREEGWLCNGCYLFTLRNGTRRPVDETKRCYNCKTTSSLLRWKKGPNGVDLCESCGRFWEKYHSYLKLQCLNCSTTLSRCWRRDAKGNYICESCRLKNPSLVVKASSKRRRRKAFEMGDDVNTEDSSLPSSPSKGPEEVDVKSDVNTDEHTVGSSPVQYSDEIKAEKSEELLDSVTASSPSRNLRSKRSLSKNTEKQNITFLLNPKTEYEAIEFLPPKKAARKRRKMIDEDAAMYLAEMSQMKPDASPADQVADLQEKMVRMQNNEKTLLEALEDFQRKEAEFNNWKDFHTKEILKLKSELERTKMELYLKDEELQRLKKANGKDPQVFTPKLFLKSVM